MTALAPRRTRPDASIYPNLLAASINQHLERHSILALAAESGVTRRTIDRIRFCTCMVTVDTADRLCMALDLRLDDIDTRETA